MEVGPRNLITDVPGLTIGQAQDARLASGVTVALFDRPAVASVFVPGGAPAGRDLGGLEPERGLERIDAVVLSGGSAFGLDAGGGVQGFLRERGRGLPVRGARVPIAPTAILFDLLNGGDKRWVTMPPYWALGQASAEDATSGAFPLGTVGAGFGATTADLKGGLGSASGRTADGIMVGALVAVNALGQTTIGDTPHFWAAPFEQDAEFGGLGWPAGCSGAPPLRIKGRRPENTTIAVVVTDAALSKAQCKRLAVMAHDGLAQSIRPSHAAFDGDAILFAATARSASPREPDLTAIGSAAAECLARAIARGIYEATALPFAGALPSWRDRFASRSREQG